jgi:hypothetical protein
MRYLTWVKPVWRSLCYRPIVAALGGFLAGPSAVFVITNDVNQKVRQDRAAIVFFKDNAQASAGIPHLSEACVPLSVLAAYCCGSGWLPWWSVRCVRNHQRGQPESAPGSCSHRLL